MKQKGKINAKNAIMGMERRRKYFPFMHKLCGRLDEGLQSIEKYV